jgi:hemerythrin superfamily protein
MDALELLKSDHGRIKSLYAQFTATGGRQKQLLIFRSLQNEIESHLSMEETVFYPAFRNYPDFEQSLLSSTKEHQEVKAILGQISELSSDSPDFIGKVDLMMQALDAHFQLEESEFFTSVRKTMKRAEREQLGRYMQAAKTAGTGIAA